MELRTVSRKSERQSNEDLNFRSYMVRRVGTTCLPFDLKPPATQPFEFENIAIMSNGRCASACSLFSISMSTRHNVKTVVVGGKPGTTQQYCAVVGGESLNYVVMNNELKETGLKGDPLAPPNFLTNSYQGENNIPRYNRTWSEAG
jgi:hypothetical protein